MKYKMKIGSIINIQGYKHNGRLYRQWNGVRVIGVSKEHAALLMYKTKVIEDTGEKWVVREPMLWFFLWDELYNTTALIRSTGAHFYTNLASTPVYEDQTLKFIDYDLDIKAYPGQKTKIVDKHEFNRHSSEYKYPQELIEQINKTTNYVMALITKHAGYFDEDVIDTYIEDLIAGQQLPKKFQTK